MARARVLFAVFLLTLAAIGTAAPAYAAPVTNCPAGPGPSTSGTHTICLTAPSETLTGEQLIAVTNSPNNRKVIFSWLPDGKRIPTYLQTSFVSNPTRPQNYSFVWPTDKYPDGSGLLQAQFGSTTTEIVWIRVTLQNGNPAGSYRQNPRDWAPPAPWAGTVDPVVAAVGDGASNEKASNAVADSIVRATPDLFLYLGDVYEEGTFTEYRNHYGVSSVDDPSGAGTLWGRLAGITEATFGNHEVHSEPAFLDYWHRTPSQMYTMFEIGGVQFLNLWSGRSQFNVGTQQYEEVEAKLRSLSPNTCVVAFWHQPVVVGTQVRSNLLPVWQLLADNGGDVVLNGDAHFLAEYEPLDRNLEPDEELDPAPDAHMVQLISGAGGHALSQTKLDLERMAWPTSQIKQSGAVYLTLNGAAPANGGTATSITWSFEDTNATTASLQTGHIDC